MSRSPERQRLAARIAQCAEAADRLSGTREALSKAQDLQFEAQAAERRAEAELITAQEGAGRWLADQLRNGEVLTASPVKAAEAAVAEAREAVAAARAAGEVLQAQIEADQHGVEQAQRQVRAAAVEVLRASPGVEAAIERLEAAQAELAAASAVVGWLQTSRIIEMWSPVPGGLGALAVRAQEARRGSRLPQSGPVLAAWSEALEGLLTDPDAPVP